MRGGALRLAATGAVAASLVLTPFAANARTTGCTATGWAGFQHDPLHTGTGCTKSISTSTVAMLRPRWFVPTNGAITAEPIVEAGTVYVGDSAGVFRAVDAATGSVRWSFNVTNNRIHSDKHSVSYSEIDSTATYAVLPRLGPTVFLGGGGTVYALDARTGKPRWAADTDPGQPTSPAEVESSPAIWYRHGAPAALIVGEDVNESDNVAHTGLLSFNPATGALLWKFDPETATVTHSLTAGEHHGAGCGDVWSSPAIDAHVGLVFFSTGNCDVPSQAQKEGGATTQAVWALHLRTGALAWRFEEPKTIYNYDDDFGASPTLVSLGRNRLVVQCGKSGFCYGLAERTGSRRWSAQVAQPGQSGPQLAGALGGVIGSPANGRAGSRPAVFSSSAIPLPFTGSGPPPFGKGSVDTTLIGDPTRAGSLHAVDAATGKVLWQQPLQAPSYAPVTYANGVVFAPSTVGFAALAFDAATGRPLWAMPLAASPSSGITVSGPDIYFGTGTYESAQAPVPPQLTGLWSFGVG